MILGDSSAWIEFDRGTDSPTALRLRTLLLAGDLAITEPVAMELLAGAVSDSATDELRTLVRAPWLLPFDPVADFEGAARIYRDCRRNGVTPRGMVDCMIAAVAWRHGVPILTADADFARIGSVVGVDVEVG